MPLRERPPRRRSAPALVLTLATLFAGALAALPAAAAPSPSAGTAPSATLAADATPRFPLDAAAVEAAASAQRAQSGYEETHREHTWRFKKSGDKKEARPSATWLIDLMGWLAESGRVVVWLLGAALLAVVVVTARRWLAVRGEFADVAGKLPSHVRELDIRPESLPDDVGAAVRALWLAGERRAALSLLYRGALSRLVHSHGVAIDAASTEGDCVRLARAALRTDQGSFVQALVQVWQLAIYGNRGVESQRVLQLCAEFDQMLPRVAPMAASA